SVGGTVMISQKFDAPTTYERLCDPQLAVTHYFCVTQMAMSMRQLPGFDGRRLARLTALITGGAPNPEAHIRQWLNDGVTMINAWGMSEIWVRGWSVTPGYWERPDLDAQAFKDGWFRTGDVAIRDAAGCYTLVDRIK